MGAPRRILLAAALAAMLAPPGLAQEKKPAPPLPNAIILARSWEEATREAQIRNVPILFTTALAT